MSTYDDVDRDGTGGGYEGGYEWSEGHGFVDREPFLRGREFQGGAGAHHGGMNVGDLERWASIAAGVGVVALGARQRRVGAVAAGLLGAGLIVRGVGGRCPVYRATHRNTRLAGTREALGGARGVHVHKVMVINRPVEAVYQFWRDFSNLPRVMRHLASVTPIGNGRSHWVAKGPAGLHVAWDAEIINEEENRVIGWRSLDQADVVSAGSVTFRPAPLPAGAAAEGGATEIAVRLQYAPPAGKVGALVARLFGEEPSQQIGEDLRRVKEFLETGEPETADSRTSERLPFQPAPAVSDAASGSGPSSAAPGAGT